MYFAQFEVLAVVGALTLAQAAQHGGAPAAARRLAAEGTPHAALDAPDTVHDDAFFGRHHRGGVQSGRSNPHEPTSRYLLQQWYYLCLYHCLARYGRSTSVDTAEASVCEMT